MADTGSNADRNRFDFTHKWFDMTLSEWEERTASIRDQELRVLEIGSFEGGSTTWMLDHLMSHPKSSLTAIDTFAGNMEHQDHPDVDYQITTLEQRFWSNVRKCSAFDRMHVMKGSSHKELIKLRANDSTFNFIYIDGSHTAFDVLYDAVLCWEMLETGGTMVFDDYAWDRYNEESYCPRVAIDAFIRCAAPELESSRTKTQMWIKRVPNHIPPTPNRNTDIMYWGHTEWSKDD